MGGEAFVPQRRDPIGSSVLDDIHGKEPEQRQVSFCLDRELREQLATAQFELSQAQRRRDLVSPGNRGRVEDAQRDVDELQDRVDELAEQAKGRIITFVFAALEPNDFDDLKGEHRPTSVQLSEARKAKEPQPEWNPDTFPPALVAAACVNVTSPSGSQDGLSVEDAQKMWRSRSYNEAERGELFGTALSAQLTRIKVDLPKGG
jgi:hypothetical protein